MNTENTKEIVKALSYDISIEDIAAFEEITEAEVQAIAERHAADIKEIKEYRAKMEG